MILCSMTSCKNYVTVFGYILHPNKQLMQVTIGLVNTHNIRIHNRCKCHYMCYICVIYIGAIIMYLIYGLSILLYMYDNLY